MALTFTSVSDRYRILSALRGCLDGQCTGAGNIRTDGKHDKRRTLFLICAIDGHLSNSMGNPELADQSLGGAPRKLTALS